MKKTDTWMPLYVADYLADTSRLTTEQHGAYLLILMDYWRKGAPPDDASVLASITRLSPAQWRKHSSVLRPFFIVIDGKWTQKRLDHERSRAMEISSKRSETGSIGASKRWRQDDGKTMANAMANPLANGWQTASQSDAPSQSHISPSEKMQVEPSARVDAKASADRLPCPYARIAAAWNETCVSMSAVKPVAEWSAGRKAACRSRWKDKLSLGRYANEESGVTYWRRLFAILEESDFLAGRTAKWRADFDWVMNPTNLLKILEGKYVNESQAESA